MLRSKWIVLRSFWINYNILGKMEMLRSGLKYIQNGDVKIYSKWMLRSGKIYSKWRC